MAAFEISTTGVEAQPLADALESQWEFGFPAPPRAASARLTHGFFRYPAGLQPIAAQQLLGALPDGALLDPFCGGGTSLIEAMRSGRRVIGSDASPLALFAAAHHTWASAADDDLGGVREVAKAAVSAVRAPIADGASPPLARGARAAWAALRAAVDDAHVVADSRAHGGGHPAAGSDAAAVLCPAHFCIAAAIQRAERALASGASSAGVCDTYLSTVDGYCRALSALRRDAGAAPPALLLHRDARALELPRGEHVDAVLTSPPYPGVYDYLKLAREERARLASGRVPLMGLHAPPKDVRGERVSWPEGWRSVEEMGARKARRRRPAQFGAAWQRDQAAWLTAVARSVRVGGRIAIVIGDGDGIDAAASTHAAADATRDLALVASATIQATGERSQQRKGNRRTEHALLYERVG